MACPIKYCRNIELTGFLGWTQCRNPGIGMAVYFDGKDLHSVQKVMKAPCMRFEFYDNTQTPMYDANITKLGMV